MPPTREETTYGSDALRHCRIDSAPMFTFIETELFSRLAESISGRTLTKLKEEIDG